LYINRIQDYCGELIDNLVIVKKSELRELAEERKELVETRKELTETRTKLGEKTATLGRAVARIQEWEEHTKWAIEKNETVLAGIEEREERHQEQIKGHREHIQSQQARIDELERENAELRQRQGYRQRF